MNLPESAGKQKDYSLEELNPNGDHTIILVGGVTEGVKTQESFALALAEEQFRVINYDLITQPLDYDHPKRYHEAKSEQTAELLKRVLADGEKATLFAHSQGAIFAIDAALSHPEHVDRLILANPAGLFEDSFARLSGRFALETTRKTATAAISHEARVQQIEGTKAIITKPKSFLGDAVDISNSDIRDRLDKLKELGIPVDIFVSAKDQVFPWRLQKEYFEDQEPEEFAFNSVSSYFNTKPKNEHVESPARRHRLAGKWAGHDQNIVYPKQTAKLVKQIVQ